MKNVDCLITSVSLLTTLKGEPFTDSPLLKYFANSLHCENKTIAWPWYTIQLWRIMISENNSLFHIELSENECVPWFLNGYVTGWYSSEFSSTGGFTILLVPPGVLWNFFFWVPAHCNFLLHLHSLWWTHSTSKPCNHVSSTLSVLGGATKSLLEIKAPHYFINVLHGLPIFGNQLITPPLAVSTWSSLLWPRADYNGRPLAD